MLNWNLGNPELAAKLLNPDDGYRFTSRSRNAATWKCEECGHVWSAPVKNRASGSGCPSCSGNEATSLNCLATVAPDLARELADPEDGQRYTGRSNQSVSWRCSKCGHEWVSSIGNRAQGCGCPACDGKAVTNDNCLAAVNPDLVSELVNPEDGFKVTGGSKAPLEWRCPNCEYVWKSSVKNRVNGSGCPVCSESRGEKAVAKTLDQLGIRYQRQVKFDTCKHKRPLPFDFMCPGNTLIEFDGRQHHEADEFFGGEAGFIDRQFRDAIKTDWAKENGYFLVRVTIEDVKDGEWLIPEALLSRMLRSDGGD